MIQFFDRNVFLSFSSIGYQKEMDGVKRNFFLFLR